MSLTIGQRLGPYEILASIGAGGMGEVYRARDTRLDRTVAIKTLPSQFSQNAELRQRFEREARAVSSLSHPHICSLYDVGRHEGVEYIVMELLEGETLDARLRKGPLPREDLLRHAIEIASALDVAHQQGLIHRDLKPGNIMLTKSGAKLLDFGLAKSLPSVAETAGATAAPTVTSPLTAKGTIVGTFQYMSPEQLEGGELDARSDIFAFGAVLYEMATGTRAFSGKTQAGVIAAILEREPPPVSSLQPASPPALDRLIETCLAKNPDDRRQTMHDVLLDLKWIAEGGSQAGIPAQVSSRRRWRERLAWILVGICALVAAVLGVAHYRSAHQDVRVVRAAILPPPNAEYFLLSYTPGAVTIAPDGRRLVFAAREPDDQPRLWIRDLDAIAARPLAGTEGAAYPFWSPDGKTIGFFADGKLKKISASGGPSFTLCDANNMKGGTWNQHGTILFAPDYDSGIYRVSAAGGEPTPVTTPDTLSILGSHRHPHFLPDGRRFLYLARRIDPDGRDSVRVGTLDGDEDRALMPGESNVAFASGHLLYLREGMLMARPFDHRRVRFTGEAFPIAERIRYLAGARLGVFSTSQNGVLVYQVGGEEGNRQLVWLDRKGEQLGRLGDCADYMDARISPDGERVAATIRDPQLGTPDIWIYEVASGVRSRFTFDPGDDGFPVWAPDGGSIIFASTRGGRLDLYRKSVGGTEPEELLLESQEGKFPTSWSADGRFLLYETQGDVSALPLFGDGRPIPILQSEHHEADAVFSPDGKWIAYSSNESGLYEIFVTGFPDGGRKWQVSVNGGAYPFWIEATSEIHFTGDGMTAMAVEVHTDGSTFQAGAPTVLFDVSMVEGGDVARDGQSALLILPAGQTTIDPLTLVINWTAGLDRK